MSKTTIPTGGITADAIDATLVADDAISEEHIDATVITASTALAAEPADTDEFLLSDAGVIKRIDYSLIKGAGKVVQYVIATNSAEGTNGTTTFNSTGLTLDITPTNASNKMVIIAQDSFKAANDGSTNASGREAIFALFQDTSELNDTKATVGRTEIAASTSATPTALGTVTLIGTQAAGNTSERTYTLKVKTNGAAVASFNESGHDSFMIALELKV